jgi:hypothetical protein
MTLLETLTPTWDYAAEQVVHIYDQHTASGPVDLDALRFFRDAMADKVRNGEDIGSMLFYAIGTMACAELMDMELWDTVGMVDLLVMKQTDYGHDNINAFGHVGIAVRLCDKIARFLNLTTVAHDAKNEPLVDTLYDMVGYCVIAEMLGNGTFDLQLAEAA